MGKAYCGGYTYGSLGEPNENPGGFNNKDLFMMELTTRGAVRWVTQFGTLTSGFADASNSETDQCNAVAVGLGGTVHCAGYTKGAIGEGNSGNKDVLIIKLNRNGTL